MNLLRPSAVLAATAAIGLCAAGCGSSDSGSGSGATGGAAATGATTTITAQLTPREKAVKFAECVRAHGVRDFPDPNADNDFDYGISVSVEVWTAAVNACKAWQPPGTLSGQRSPEQQSASLKFAQCIRDHGVKDFPDPVNGQPLVDTRKIPSANAAGGMTILNTAMAQCKTLMLKVLDKGR